MKVTIMLLAAVACGDAVPPDGAPKEAAEKITAVTPTPKVVAIGPAIAQIVHKLTPKRLIAVDDAGKELEGLGSLPTVGFSRNISAEGVLSTGPTLVLADERAGPPEAFELLKSAGVELKRFPHERSRKGVKALTVGVAKALGADPTSLLEHFDASCDSIPKLTKPTTALFIYARGGGLMNASGTGTAANAMLELVGLTNAITSYKGYKPLTPEAAVAAAPDVIVFTTKGLESAGGVEGVKTTPGLSLTEAVKQGRVIAVDDLQLLAFGLDTCDGASALVKQINL